MLAAHSWRVKDLPAMAHVALRTSRGNAMCHSLAVPSWLAVARSLPLGLNATAVTKLLSAVSGAPICR